MTSTSRQHASNRQAPLINWTTTFVCSIYLQTQGRTGTTHTGTIQRSHHRCPTSTLRLLPMCQPLQSNTAAAATSSLMLHAAPLPQYLPMPCLPPPAINQLYTARSSPQLCDTSAAVSATAPAVQQRSARPNPKQSLTTTEALHSSHPPHRYRYTQYKPAKLLPSRHQLPFCDTLAPHTEPHPPPILARTVTL